MSALFDRLPVQRPPDVIATDRHALTRCNTCAGSGEGEPDGCEAMHPCGACGGAGWIMGAAAPPAERAHDPGGTPLPLPAGVVAQAVYGGPGDCYRYRLDWRWSDGPALMALMMNPSVAGHASGDRTVAKMQRYAAAHRFGRLLVGNVHAYRATDQRRLAEVADPVGPDNARHVLGMAAEAAFIVVGYGRPKLPALRSTGPLMARQLVAAGHTLHALRVSADGTPWHPLYLPASIDPQPWSPA